MATIAFILILVIFYFYIEQKDIKMCLLLWSAIFFLDLLIPVNETYFQVSVFIDICLLFSCLVIKARWKMFGCVVVLILSAVLNIREGVSYYQTSTYTFLVYYQWISVEILIVILLWGVKLKHVKHRNIC